MGSEGRQELEGKIDELEDKVEECEKMQRDVFIVICQKLIGIMSEHLTHCDQEGLDYETSWFVYNLDYLRQLLVQVGIHPAPPLSANYELIGRSKSHSRS